jgi:HTH-type transcriptional regulator/antitoxin HipB
MPSSRTTSTTSESSLAALGAAVRARRAELGLSQLELAQLSGCGVVFVYALEKGKPTLRIDKLLAVLDVLGLRLELSVGPPGVHVVDSFGVGGRAP